MTPVRPITSQFSIAAQIDPKDMEAISGAGFRTILSARPDGEETLQPDFAEIAAAAQAAGMKAHHIPVVAGSITDDDVAKFSAALRELPAPVLGFCRSGMRAATLWGLSKAGELSSDEIISVAASADCDLSPIKERLGKGSAP